MKLRVFYIKYYAGTHEATVNSVTGCWIALILSRVCEKKREKKTERNRLEGYVSRRKNNAAGVHWESWAHYEIPQCKNRLAILCDSSSCIGWPSVTSPWRCWSKWRTSRFFSFFSFIVRSSDYRPSPISFHFWRTTAMTATLPEN